MSKIINQSYPLTNDHKEMNEQQQFIAAARELLMPYPVIRGAVPEWFGWDNVQYLSRASTEATIGNIADHYGTVHVNAIDYFVCEPYGLGRKAIDIIDDLCHENGFTWLIDPNSYHYPCRTIRVVFSNRDYYA